MSETEVTPTVVTEPVVAEPTPEVVPAPPTAPAVPAGPQSKRDARMAARQDAAKLTETPPVQDPATTAPEAAKEPAAATETEPATTEPPATAETPVEAPKALRVEIPQDHPVREMGTAEITVTDEQQARAVRALVNGTYHRRQDITNRDQRIAAQDKRIAELEEQTARFEAGQVAQQKWEKSPDYQKAAAEYQRIRELEEGGQLEPGAASRYWKGIQQDLARLEGEEFRTRMDSRAAERNKAHFAEWRDATWARVQDTTPEPIKSLPEFPTLFQNAILEFNEAVRLGTVQGLVVGDIEGIYKAFRTFFNARVISHPRVMQVYQQMKTKEAQETTSAREAEERARKEREAIEKAAVEKHMQGLAAKRGQVPPPNPLGRLGAASRPHVPTDDPNGQAPAAGTPHDIKRQAKAGSREDAARRFGMR
jgi:hypothetical protein